MLAMKTDKLTAQLEAVLSAQSEPMEISDLAELTQADAEAVERAVTKLEHDLESRGLNVIRHENQVQLVTDPEHSEIVAEKRQQEIDTNLTKAQSEALAVIAYMTPVGKAAIDFVRGVNSRAVLRNLMTRGLINKDRSGEMVTFSVSSEALQHLGITDVEELPKYEQTRKRLTEFVDTNREDQ